ncbi:MAG: hypothetical protein ABSF35_14890 [Polyangia bacterium]|jgi:hypothetical protein
MRVLAVFLAAVFVLMGLPALASAAPADSFRPAASSAESSCRTRRKKAKKQAADSKGKKKSKKDDKKPYGFEL